MNRREFIGSSAVAVGAAGALTLEPEAEAAAVIREVYELRHYRLKPDAAPDGLLDYFAKALIPAARRQGLGPVGVFTEQKPSAEPTVTLLLAFPVIAAFWAFADKLAADKEYQSAGAAYVGASPQSPAYARIESSLLAAFAGMPRVEAPDTAKERQFELRTYESHSEAAHARKVGMFNDGEIAIFRRCGLAPVFFGSTLIGTRRPNLTYMLTYPGPAERAAAWGKFINDPEWKTLSKTPGLTDPEVVSKITSVTLIPAACSQI